MTTAAVRRSLPAVRDEVDRFCGELRSGLLADLPPGELFAVELLLREALTNAIVHGSREERSATIECEVRLVEGGIKIRVFDRGAGFDWRSRAAEARGPNEEGGRGLRILDLYANQVVFSEQGNQVELTRRFCEEGPDGV